MSTRISRLLFSACLELACIGSRSGVTHAQALTPASEPLVAELIYDAGLRPGWQDWGWGMHQLSVGPALINFSQYGGWILHHDPLTVKFGGLSFQMQAPASYGKFLQVQLANGGDPLPPVAIGVEHTLKLRDGWVQIYVPWVEINPSAQPFDRITLHAKVSVGSEWVRFDKVTLTQYSSLNAPPAAATAATRSATLSVDCRAAGHAISPYIYGVAGSIGDLPATASRWGGNPRTRYNWQLGNANNVGKDWFFENVKTEDYRDFLADNTRQHVFAALTIPLIGWVAKDTSSAGFPSSTYGPQQAHDPYRADVGNGVGSDGVQLKPGSPTLTSVPAPPAMMRNWVETIVRKDATAAGRSVGMYILDNEPSLWNHTHRDVHPDPVGYEELLDRTIQYGTAIRSADPRARIAGPAEWGWTNYFYSAQDAAIGFNLRPDRRAHGDVPLLQWYLTQAREHERKTGIRVLDVLDLHFYPQAAGVYGAASDPASAALRLRSTRALWDPTYKDESWINDTVRLIPRMREWVQQNYPGLEISIGEYNFGGEQHISGALALAEALGHFGVEGLDYAFYWFAPPKGSPVDWAFRAYRDFDGKGGQFLSRSMPTRTASGVSLFASRDETGKHLVLIALNLDPKTNVNAAIDLDGCAPALTRKKFTYFSGAASLINDGDKAGADLHETLPPYSINVFDIVLQ